MKADLDSLLAAKAEQQKEAHEFTLRGEVFQLPPRMPYEYAWLLYEREERAAYRLLLGEEQLEKLMSFQPPVDQLEFMAIAEFVAKAYAMDGMGELLASGSSYTPTSNSLRPTSEPTTAD